MSFQEEKLTAIADAIREKDGTTALILADDFPARIRAIPSGGGSDFAVPLIVTTEVDALITAVNGGITVSGTAGEDGTATLILTTPGEWTVTAKWNGKEKTASVAVDDAYRIKIQMISRLPDGYTEVEYIQSDKLCQINTDYRVVFNKTRIVMDIEAIGSPSSSEYLFHAAASGSYQCYVGRKSSSAQWFYKFGTNAQVTTDLDITDKRFIIDCDFTKSTLFIDDHNYSIYKGSQMTGILAWFARSPGGLSSSMLAKMYSARIYDAGVLLFDFVPCINPGGTVGLYELVNGKFYTDAGKGTLTAGPAV